MKIVARYLFSQIHLFSELHDTFQLIIWIAFEAYWVGSVSYGPFVLALKNRQTGR